MTKGHIWMKLLLSEGKWIGSWKKKRLQGCKVSVVNGGSCNALPANWLGPNHLLPCPSCFKLSKMIWLVILIMMRYFRNAGHNCAVLLKIVVQKSCGLSADLIMGLILLSLAFWKVPDDQHKYIWNVLLSLQISGKRRCSWMDTLSLVSYRVNFWS